MTEAHTIRPIDLLDLPTRARNALVDAGLTTPEELMHRSDEELLALYGIGPVSLRQLKARLALWEQDHQPPEETGEASLEKPHTLRLLPGRHVLHATWLPGSPGRVFLWAEGTLLSSPPSHCHPFHLRPAELRDLLAELMPEGAEETAALAHLPMVDGRPQASPQLIRDRAEDEIDAAPEALGRWRVEGLALPPSAALQLLNDLPRPQDMVPRAALSADLQVWSLAAKLVLELLARQQFAPTLVRRGEVFRAAWVPVLDQPEDLRRVEQLARSLPPIGRALVPDQAQPEPFERDGVEAPAARALLKDFLGTLMDAAVRAWAPPLPHVIARRDAPVLQSWLMALFASYDQATVDGPIQELERLHAEVARWSERLLAGAEAPFRVCFRLEAPETPDVDDASLPMDLHVPSDGWTLRFLLQARDDPSLLVPAGLVWRSALPCATWIVASTTRRRRCWRGWAKRPACSRP